jgi:hypothetical protein
VGSVEFYCRNKSLPKLPAVYTSLWLQHWHREMALVRCVTADFGGSAPARQVVTGAVLAVKCGEGRRTFDWVVGSFEHCSAMGSLP